MLVRMVRMYSLLYSGVISRVNTLLLDILGKTNPLLSIERRGLRIR
jgi:hypothetical protein